MKSFSVVVTAWAVAASMVHAFNCPDAQAITVACRQLNVFPLVCTDPKRNVKECNEKQCNQAYIDNYAVCQCRGNPTNFYKSSNNVEGLLRRCGSSTGKTFANPYGSPEQYRPGEGTRTFPLATRVFDGTTYVGGQTEVVDGITRIVGATPMVGMTRIVGGTTSWNGATPSIVGGTSTVMQAGPSPTAQPVVLPTPTAVPFTQQGRISGGAIAGIVLGLLAAAAIAFLLALCWRRKRKDPAYNQHLLAEPSRGPSRTVVTEKIEPVVVKAVPSNQVYTSGTGTDIGTGTGTGTITGTTSSVMAPQSGIVTAGGGTGVASTTHPSTSYNTTTVGGYNTQPRTVGDTTINHTH